MTTRTELMDLMTKIRLGEDSSVEFKTVEWQGTRVQGPDRDSMAQEIAAFANSRGGQIIFGVAPKTRDVVGIDADKLDLLGEWLANVVENKIAPPPTFYARRLELPDAAANMRAVMLIDVPQSLFVHAASGEYYRRQGETKRPMSPQELQRLFQQRGRAGLIVFDELPVPGCLPSDLSPVRVAPLLGSGIDPDDLKLRKLKIIVADEQGQECVSVAGCLMATEEPSRWLRSAYVQCVRYLGTERNAEQQHDAVDFTGPANTQINGATDFVLRNMHTGARKHLGRVDVPQYDVQAVFEAIANAVVHRDYSIAGAPVQVHQFADRLEITSAGALPNSQSLDSIALRPATRNELLATFLARSTVTVEGVQRRHIVEKRGEGVPLINDGSYRVSGRLPRFELLGDNALRVTLFAADPLTSPLGSTPVLGGIGVPRIRKDRDES